MKKVLGFLLAAALLTCAVPAQADVQRGDRGEEVKYLQWLLQKDGWLFEEPDGAFGGHTEQAVLEYQSSKGLEETGIADYELMYLLDQDRIRLGKLHYGDDFYDPYPGDYTPPFETDVLNDPVPGCTTTALRDTLVRVFCPGHAELLTRDEEMTAADTASGWSEAAALWSDEIDRLYGQWLADYPDEDMLDILAAYSAWQAYAAESAAAMYAMGGSANDAEKQLCLMQRYYAGSLCEMRDGAAYDRDREFRFEEDDTGYGAYCIRDSGTGGGKDTFRCCDLHTGLMNREYERYFEVTDPMEGLDAVVGEWLSAADEMFGQWEALCRDEDLSESVRRAGDHFHTVIDAMESAGAGYDGLLRVVQWECCRLCSWLGSGPAE